MTGDPTLHAPADRWDDARLAATVRAALTARAESYRSGPVRVDPDAAPPWASSLRVVATRRHRRRLRRTAEVLAAAAAVAAVAVAVPLLGRGVLGADRDPPPPPIVSQVPPTDPVRLKQVLAELDRRLAAVQSEVAIRTDACMVALGYDPAGGRSPAERSAWRVARFGPHPGRFEPVPLQAPSGNVGGEVISTAGCEAEGNRAIWGDVTSHAILTALARAAGYYIYNDPGNRALQALLQPWRECMAGKGFTGQQYSSPRYDVPAGPPITASARRTDQPGADERADVACQLALDYPARRAALVDSDRALFYTAKGSSDFAHGVRALLAAERRVAELKRDPAASASGH